MSSSVFSGASSASALSPTKSRGLLRREVMAIDGRMVPVHIRHNPRARRFIVKVDLLAGSVEITTPFKSRLPEALRFAAEQHDWIARRLREVPPPVPFADGAVIPFQGQDHFIRHVGTARPAGARRQGPVRRVDARSDALSDAWSDALSDAGPASGGAILQSPGQREIHVTGQPEFIDRRVRDWLKVQAREALSERVLHYCALFDLQPARISVRDQTTRWGSCSAARVLSFSWRLILAPAHVLDYVAAHEVVHLRHMNHGKRFWAMLEKAVPSADPAKYWLERHGPGLHRYGGGQNH